VFTGIIEKTARVTRLAARPSGATLSVTNPWDTLPGLGESIAVNGACLTVVSANQREISFDVSAETLKKTTFSRLAPGDVANLEKALRLGDDVSGHLVAGHVDGVGDVLALERRADFADLRVRVPDDLAVYLVPKGSVAVDGVSLTIASLSGNEFTVAVIPETLSRTTLGALRPGSRVNMETDMLGKYVIRYMSQLQSAPASSGLTLKRLEELGF